MDPNTTSDPSKKTVLPTEPQESQKKENQYGYRQPRTERESSGVDADEERQFTDDVSGVEGTSTS